MKTNGNDKTLESYKIFPYIAWIVTIVFAVFVYNITVELRDTVHTLQIQTQYLQEAVGVNNLPANHDVDQTTN